MDVGTLSVKLSVLDQDAIKSLDSFQNKMKTVGANMAKIGAGMSIALTTPIVLAGKSMFTAASDFAESINKVEVSFGDASDEVKNFAKTALKNFGIAEGSALDMAALFVTSRREIACLKFSPEQNKPRAGDIRVLP